MYSSIIRKVLGLTIELNITIENLMFLVSDASNKKIFISFSYTEVFRRETERIRSLNFHQDILRDCCAVQIFLRDVCFQCFSQIKKAHILRWPIKLQMDWMVEKYIILCYYNAIFLRYLRQGDATWDFQKKLKESDRDVF